MAASLSIVKPPWQLDCFPGYCGPASDPETQNRAPSELQPGPLWSIQAGSTLRTPGQCLRGLGTCNAGPLHVPAAALLGRRPSPGLCLFSSATLNLSPRAPGGVLFSGTLLSPSCLQALVHPSHSVSSRGPCPQLPPTASLCSEVIDSSHSISIDLSLSPSFFLFPSSIDPPAPLLPS